MSDVRRYVHNRAERDLNSQKYEVGYADLKLGSFYSRKRSSWLRKTKVAQRLKTKKSAISGLKIMLMT